MKDKKNRSMFSNPLFSKAELGRFAHGSSSDRAYDALQEYSLLHILRLKLKESSIFLVEKTKQYVLIYWQVAFKSMIFWKSLVFIFIFGWFYNYTKDVSVRFHWPVTVRKGLMPENTNNKFALPFASIFTGGEAAPIAADNLNRQKTEKYIRQYAKVAIAEHRKYGIPASVKMAQAIIESRAGASTLAQNNDNHFGMKCFSKKCQKGHCTNLTDDSHKDFFRKYPSAWASWRAHSVLLKSKRYQPLQKLGVNYKAWAKGLKKLGYATDKKYDKKLIQVIEDYQLYRLDQQ